MPELLNNVNMLVPKNLLRELYNVSINDSKVNKQCKIVRKRIFTHLWIEITGAQLLNSQW